MADFDFDNLLGDLNSAIADLETISVPTAVNTASTNPVFSNNYNKGSVAGTATPPYSSGSLTRYPQAERKPIPNIDHERNLKEQDFDLDDLLSDLSSFDPMKTVGGAAPPPTTYREPAKPQWEAVAPPPGRRHLPPVENNVSNGVHGQPSPQQSPQHQAHHTPQQMSPAHPVATSNNNNVAQRQENQPEITVTPDPEIEVVKEASLEGASQKISKQEVEIRLEKRAEELKQDMTLTEDDREAKLKEEKMRIALEKLKVASKKTVAIKVFNNDGSNKTVVVEDGMSAAVVCYLLVTKNHFEESPNWALIERLGDVYLERQLEDHECVVDVYSHWARDTNNQFMFKLMEDKYELFENPTKYFPSLLTNTLIGKDKQHRAEKARKILVQEYFSSALRVPELEGYLHLKDGYKSKWKKLYFILRASGLYHTIKGTKKTSKNLQLLCYFSDYDLYRGVNFKKTLKAPSDFCLALRPKPSQIQMVPGAKDIKAVCIENEDQFLSWYSGIRLAIYGKQLYDNYYKAHVKQFKLEGAEGEEASLQQRLHSLSGYRLEKHLDRKREAYQKEREAREQQEQMLRGPRFGEEEEDGSSEDRDSVDDNTEPVAAVPPKPAPKPAPKPVRNRPPGHQQPPQPTHHEHYPQSHHEQHHQQHPYPHYPAPTTSPPLLPPQDPHRSAHPMAGHGPVAVPTPTSPTPQLQPLTQFAWYHGAIPREEAVRRLEQMGSRDGLYLVRDSSSVANSYVLTMFAKSVPKNFQIMLYEGPGGQVVYRIDDGPAFPNVEEMLNHYKNTVDRLPCRLTDFCPRPPTRMTEC